MKIKEQTLKELETLSPSEINIVYDLILSLKNKISRKQTGKPHQAYKKVRDILKVCNGSLSNDVIITREDRI